MSNYLRTNCKRLRKETMSDTTITTKRQKSTDTVVPMNLMKFVEILPQSSNNVPHPRSGHRAVATESDFWMWGGYHPAAYNQDPHMFNELWRFNFALEQWTLEPTTGDAPDLTPASHSMHLFGNLVFLFGGTGYPFGANVSNDLYILDLKRRHWRRCQLNNQQPERVYGASMIRNNDHLYILCGTYGVRYNSNVYDIHLPTLTSTQIGHTFDEIEDFLDNGRYRQEVHLHDNKIFVFGGSGSSGISFSLQNLPVFDLDTRTWSFIQTNPDPVHNFPSARKFHTVLPFRPNQVIVFGGARSSSTPNNHSIVDGHIWLFDLDRLQWSRLSSLMMPRPTFFHAAAMNERGEIWTHGGVINYSRSIANEIRINKLYKMHTRVLKLSEMCWNYFLNRLSDRNCLIEQPKLFSQLHIPSQFSERVH